MKHNIIIPALTLLLFSAAGSSLQAQSNIMYGSTRIPQMNTLNPAFFPANCNVYVNTLGINLNTSIPITLKDIVYDTVLSNHSTGASQHYNYVNLNGMIDKLTDNSQINFNLNQYLLGFGFRVGHSFLTVSTQLKVSSNIGLPVDALSLLTDGNANMDGTQHTLEVASGDLLNMQAYLEAAVGYGLRIKHLTIGARLKPLIGLVNISTENTRAVVNTASDMSNMTADVYYNVRMALPVNVALTDSTTARQLLDGALDDLANVARNLDFGWGLDLGAKYEWKNFEFSASIIDLGYMKWRTTYNLHPSNGESQQFVFSGVDINQGINGGEVDFDTVLSQYKEQLAELGDATVSHGEGYTTKLQTKFNLAGFYNFRLPGITFRAGLLFHGEVTPRMAASLDESLHMLRSNVTALGSVNLFDWMEFTISNSIINNGYKTNAFNPGFGANFMIGHGAQFYVLMDYGRFNFTKMKEFNIYMGGNLMFGRKKFMQRDKSTAALPDLSDSYIL